MKKVLIFIFGVILVVVLVLALYQNTNQNTDNTQLAGNKEDSQSQTQDNNALQVEDETNGDTASDVAPEVTTTYITQTPIAPDRKLIVYIDKNKSGFKDKDESACTLCSGQSLLMGEKYSGSLFPLTNKISSASIDIKGGIKESNVGTANFVWGVFASKNIIVPTSDVAFGDGTEDINVPALEFSAKLAGVNANITEVQDIGNETGYHFSILVPMLKTSLDNGTKLYVKYSLNADESKYYIVEGKISKDPQDYVITVNWNVQSSLKAGYLNAANITFFTL